MMKIAQDRAAVRPRLAGRAGWTLVFLLAIVPRFAQAEAALFLEEPFGNFGGMNPTGHAAVYLSRVCAETPTKLRRCEEGETGVVISRYHRVAGYDWIAMPLLAYLYAVDSPGEIPNSPSADEVTDIRDQYRRNHFPEMVPDAADGHVPSGEWIQLVGAAYDRKIYSFEIETQPERDDELIRDLNARKNHTHFNLLFHNCADFSAFILNFYYPHSVHRSFVADIGIMTPKQTARSVVKYERRHSDLQFSSLVISQVPGSTPRSFQVDGVLESFVKSKKYVVPLAVLHPLVAGGVVATYLAEARFEKRPKAAGPVEPAMLGEALELNGTDDSHPGPVRASSLR